MCPMLDAVNVEDDQPELIFGPALNGESPESDVPPFYINLSPFYISRN